MLNRLRKRVILFRLFACGALALMTACSTTPSPQPPRQPENTGLVADPVLGVADTGTRCTIPAMMDLWHSRADGQVEDFPLGPGDEITISVPEIEEIQNENVRVAQDGTITLPLIGTVQVGGLDEDQARAVIDGRLAQYMRRPRLEMYVERYRSREVAVAGAVQKPGVYDLASFGDSLNDMIAMAGGLAPSAAQRAIFLPAATPQRLTAMSASSDPEPNVKTVDSNPNVNTVRTAAIFAPTEHQSEVNGGMLAHRISITLPLGRSGDEGCLNMPARPGDVILIPAAGNVTVVGWVRNPSTYTITPGMTVLGAVTAAGGAVFSRHVEVLRTDQAGERVVKRFTISDLESGAVQDIPVDAGDVVLVEKSAIGAVPYGLWELFERFGTGVGVGIPVP
jgi:protein involved in polysaccharide export with SLBB domain